MKLRPTEDRVAIRRIEEERTTAGGIVIPDTASAEKPMEGVVLHVGPGKPLDNGDTRAVSVKEGDRILLGKYAGTEIKVDGEDIVIMRETDILAVIEK